MLLQRRLQLVVREALTEPDCREILSMEPRYGRLEVFYSWTNTRPGFAAWVRGAAGEGLLAEARGHRSPIEAARAAHRQLLIRRSVAAATDAPEGPTAEFERTERNEFDGYPIPVDGRRW